MYIIREKVKNTKISYFGLLKILIFVFLILFWALDQHNWTWYLRNHKSYKQMFNEYNILSI